MVESGGSGRPRPANEERAEQATEPTAPPSGTPSHPARPTEAPTARPHERDDHRPTGAQDPVRGDRHPDEPAPETQPDAPVPPREPTAEPTPEPPSQPTPPSGAAPSAPEPAAPEPQSAPAPDAPPALPHADHGTDHSGGHRTEAGTPHPDHGTDHPGGHRTEAGTPHPHADHHPRTLAHTEDTPAAPGAAPQASPTPAATAAPPAPPRPPQRPPEPRGGLLMGRPFGVPVYVAPSWFLVAALITWVFGGQLERVLPDLGAARYLVSLFFAVAFYASVLIHELAHTVAALRFKLPVRRIRLQFFGGVSEIEKEAETPGREFVLAFVGPLLSLVLAGVFYLAMQPVEPGTVPGVLLAGLMVSNLIVAIFNLLPGLPLDGGRMLRAVVWKLTGRPMTGTVAAAWVGRALAVTVLIGLPLLTQSGALGSNAEDSVGMDTVTDALLAAILAAIIWTGAGNSLRMARLREHLPELRARNLTRRAVPVETDTPLSEALRRANDAGARALVVVDPHGEPLSLVREAAIVGVPEHRRPWVAVSGLAQDLTDGMRVSAELAGEDLLDVLRATPATEYLVVEETGEIYGVLSAADVERAFVRAMARPS
ncbi:site-2 protease family protein [Streptomyces longwoodensis]|uniref:site-2 protease family protein n=1 Tax=Streptomyces longwoodensis TaxID=68231 RepID=UPI002DD9914E|nr:site-2 protease family protein [Streptomyces longwoodensis]WRY87699.1 site-2 protease family protein [Streptomyces longwoodensis]